MRRENEFICALLSERPLRPAFAVIVAGAHEWRPYSLRTVRTAFTKDSLTIVA